MIGLILAVALVVAVVVVVLVTRSGADLSSNGGSKNLTTVNGVIGSEKKPFFNDPQVKKVFAQHGYDVQVVTAGSRQIATTVDLSKVDFVFPSSAPAAQKVKQKTGASTAYAPFYAPMAIATFTPIVQLLQAAGMAGQDASGTWHLDMSKYLAAVAAGTRWNQLPGADKLYNSSRSMLISSTDIRQSNSAAMYLSIASYVANQQNVVNSDAQQQAVIDQMATLILEQGFSASSSEEPFDDYLSQGIGSKPMVMIYEAQFLGEEMNADTRSAITPDNLPRTYAPSTRVAGRKTAHDELMDQLKILDTESARIRDAVYSREVDALSDESRFLRQKFARSSLDLGGSADSGGAPPQPAELDPPAPPATPPPPPPSKG